MMETFGPEIGPESTTVGRARKGRMGGVLDVVDAKEDKKERERGGLKIRGGSAFADVIGYNKEKEKGGKVRIQNVGGSLTFLLQFALLAWGVRQLRSVLAKRRSAAQSAANLGGSSAPAFARISPAALIRLLESNPTPYSLLDVRNRNTAAAIPAPFKSVINLPESDVRSILSLPEAALERRFAPARQPSKREVVVFLSTRGRKAEQAAVVAASLGYSRCCVLGGGLHAYNQSATSPSDIVPIDFINRDALAVLLARNHEREGGEIAKLVDLRRHDERALYGSIRGSLHLPVDQWPRALAMDADAWKQAFHFPKLGKDDLVILQCRDNNRAIWAAQLAIDAGMKRCFIYKQGVNGWHLDESVLPYEAYGEGDPPPSPLSFEFEPINNVLGEKELRAIDIL